MLGFGLGTSLKTLKAVQLPKLVTNTYSIAFDGSDDRILIADHASLSFGDASNDSAMSWSVWIKLPSGDTADHPLIVKDGSSTMEYSIMMNSSSQILFRVHDNSLEAYRGRSGGTTLSADTWYHILCTYDGTGGTDAEDGMEIYLNGVAETLTDVNAGTYVAMHNTSDPLYIGFTDRISDISAAANIDEVALWSRVLKASEIEKIHQYKRMNLAESSVGYDSNNLEGWWRMGDGDTHPIVADRRKTFFTGKSMDFAGDNDYIYIADSADFTFGDGSTTDSAFSVSAWINMDDATSFPILGKTDTGDVTEWQFATNSSDELNLKLMDADDDVLIRGLSADISAHEGSWIHVVATYSGNSGVDGINLFVNGSDANDSTATGGSYGAMHDTSAVLKIGKVEWGSSGSAFAGGKITDVAIWNAVLTAADVTAIYNSGEPTDLTLAASYNADKTSNLKGYWRLGNGIDGDVSDNGLYQILDMSDITTGSNLAKTGDDALSSWGVEGNNTNEVAGGVATLTYVDTGGSSTNSFKTRFNASATATYLFPAGTTLYNPGWYKVTISAKVNTGTVEFFFLNRNIVLDDAFGETEYTNIIGYVRRSHGDASYISIRDMGAGQVVYINSITAVKLNGHVGHASSMVEADITEEAPNRHSGVMTNMAGADIETDVPS